MGGFSKFPNRNSRFFNPFLFALFAQWQAKAIALVFVAMFAADLGADPWTMGMALGWVQLGLLALWTHDELKPYPGERVYL